MRKRSKNKDISVHAIAGIEVVLLGLHAEPKAAAGLLGFTIYRRKGKSGKEYPLGGGRIFEGIQREKDRGKIKSDKAPIQAFLWGDYVVDPKTTYTYRIVPVYGKPGSLKPRKGVSVTITTEDPEHSQHAVYFNRGVAGSQAYSRRFGRYRKCYKVEDQWREFLKPEDIPDRAAYKWLSRGLEEAMLGFINQAKGPEYSLRAAVYEFTYLPVIQAFVDALERGVDVKIVHHAKPQSLMKLKRNFDALVTVNYTDGEHGPKTLKNKEVVKEWQKDSVGQETEAAMGQIGVSNPDYQDAYDQMMIERTITQISHNKFIVLLKNNKPLQVWTGSTNFTAGGIFGQSNVGHVVRDKTVAQKYFQYWEKLRTNPKRKSLKTDLPDEGIRNWTVLQQPDLKGPPPPNSITPLFSPRLSKAILDWYADRLGAAKNAVFFTAAFSVADEIFNKVVKKKKISRKNPFLRYLLLESNKGMMRKKYSDMAKNPQNRIAWGDIRGTRDDDDEHKQFIETLTGLNDHVQYLHTKYMLIDPLSDDPTVITGSANFSKNSTVNNDENMLIIRGNTRVADIFLTEFMRLFRHFYTRNRLNELSADEAKKADYLTPDDSWTKPHSKKDTQEYTQRLLFK